MTEKTIGDRVHVLEISLTELSKSTMKLVSSQELNDRAINRLLIKFDDHFAVEDMHGIQIHETLIRNEKTISNLDSTVNSLNVQLASMPGLHEKTTRDLLTPIYNRCRRLEDKDSALQLDIKTSVHNSESKTKKDLISIGRTYAYITSFLVSIIMVVCGYLYYDLKQASDLNTKNILENIRNTHP